MPACQPAHTAGHLRSGQTWDLNRALASTKHPHLAQVRLDLSWSHDPQTATRAATCSGVSFGRLRAIALVSAPIALASRAAFLSNLGEG